MVNLLKTTTIKKALLITANILLASIISKDCIGCLLHPKRSRIDRRIFDNCVSSKIYDKNGNLIADLGAEKRSSAKTEEIPTDLVNAIVAIEDQRFFNHRGLT